jgi:hypothetical protein
MDLDRLFQLLLEKAEREPAFRVILVGLLPSELAEEFQREVPTYEGQYLGQWYHTHGLDRDCANLLGRFGIKPDVLGSMTPEQLLEVRGLGPSRLKRITEFQPTLRTIV